MVTEKQQLSWLGLIKTYWILLGEYKLKFVLWSVALNIAWIWEFVPAFLLGKMIDTLVKYNSSHSLNEFYMYVLILGIGGSLIAVLRLTSKNQLNKIDIEARYNLKVEAFNRLMNFPIEWHQQENSGNKVQRIQNGLESFRELSSSIRQEIFDIVISFTGVIIIFAFLNWYFLVFFVIYIFIFSFIQYYFNSAMEVAQEKFKQATEQSSGTYYESANNVMTIKTLGVQNSMQTNVQNSEQLAKKYSHRIRNIGNNKWKVFQVWNNLSVLIFLLMLGQNVSVGLITVGSIVVYYNYFSTLRHNAVNLAI